MDALFELVVASLSRHGIECPGDNPQLAKSVAPVKSGLDSCPAESMVAAALPDHNFRKTSQGDPAP